MRTAKEIRDYAATIGVPITVEEIQEIANLLERKGITVKVISSEIVSEGVGILTVHPNDLKKMKHLFREKS